MKKVVCNVKLLLSFLYDVACILSLSEFLLKRIIDTLEVQFSLLIEILSKCLFLKLIHNEDKRRINGRLVVQLLCLSIGCSVHSSLITKWGYVLSKRFFTRNI